MGERTPHLDASTRGGWIGLTARHNRADLIRALLEGVCYSQKDCLEIVEQMGVRAASVRVSGGGARSSFWRQMLANVLGKRVDVLETEEGSAFGAALLAMVGTSEFSSVSQACEAAVRTIGSVEPRAEEQDIYSTGHRAYQSLYPALRDLFHRSGGA
jgi:xylulokinase